MNTSATRTRRVDSPARWAKAAARAVEEGVEVRQCAGSGLWIATSGTDAGAAYELEVYGNVAIGCSCLAGMNDDPVCKHRAMYYLLVGALTLDPEPPTPAAPAVPAYAVPKVVGEGACKRCRGKGWIFYHVSPAGEHSHTDCHICGGSGATPKRLAA